MVYHDNHSIRKSPLNLASSFRLLHGLLFPLNHKQKPKTMKKLFALGLLVIASATYAQDKITIKEEMVAIDGISKNCLTVMLLDAKTDDVKKAWKKQLKDLKGKVSDKTIIFGDDCKSKEMGDNSFDVYSLVEEATDEGVRLVVAFDLGGAYLSTAAHSEKYPVAEKLVYAFAVEQSKTVLSSEIESTQKILRGFGKELAGLVKEKAEHESDIAEYEKKIEEAKGAILKNLANQANKTTEIEGMKAAVVDLEVKLKNIK
jgi:hypothetical protein